MIPETIFKDIKWEVYPPRPIGGQQCGLIPSGLKLIHEDTGFIMAIDGFKSQIKSKEFLLTCFELYLKETKIIE